MLSETRLQGLFTLSGVSAHCLSVSECYDDFSTVFRSWATIQGIIGCKLRI